jgi:hypothetical protein
MFLKFEPLMKKKQLIHLCLTMVVLQVNTFGFAQKTNENNKLLANLWFQHLSDQNTVALANMYVNSAVIESPNWDGTKGDPAAIREIYGRYFTTSPDSIHLMTNLFIKKNAIVIEYTFAGRMVNPEKNSPDYMHGNKSTLKACSRMNIQQVKLRRSTIVSTRWPF